jgi:hypothetical protein
MNGAKLINNPVWPTGPMICSKAHLPAFTTYAGMMDYLRANGPSCRISRSWECPHCGCWHAQTHAHDPSGNSSGTTRHGKDAEKVADVLADLRAFDRMDAK